MERSYPHTPFKAGGLDSREPEERRMGVVEEAAEWWVAMQGNPSLAEREAYLDWLRESRDHVAEMLRLWQLHGCPTSPKPNA